MYRPKPPRSSLDLEHPLREARIIEHGIAYLRPGPFYNAEAKIQADAWDVSGFREFIDRSFQTFQADDVSARVGRRHPHGR